MKRVNTGSAVILLGLMAIAGATATAQTPNTNVEVEPVTCWWRSNQSAARIGEHFSLTITCSVLEAEAARAVVDRTRLAPAAVQLPPYEVISGTQGEDLTSVGRRFFQYEYVLRLMTEGAFGVDVPIPSLEISYRIESRVEQDRSLQGREQTYVLPSLSMHITSLVPTDATHIREAPPPTLAAIAARENRGTLLRSVGAAAAAIGALLLIVALLRRATRSRSPADLAASRMHSDRAVLGAVERELAAVRAAAQGGWTTELATRALSATRIAASYAARQPVMQRFTDAATPVEGELTIGGGALGRRRAIRVSGSATSRTVEAIDPTLSEALTDLTSARYGREGELNSDKLNEALDTAIRTAKRVAADHGMVISFLRSVRRGTLERGQRAWAR